MLLDRYSTDEVWNESDAEGFTTRFDEDGRPTLYTFRVEVNQKPMLNVYPLHNHVNRLPCTAASFNQKIVANARPNLEFSNQENEA